MKTNILKDYKLKKNFLKKEYTYTIYKSIMHSAHATKLLKCLLKNKNNSWKIRNRVSFQKRVCLILGKHRSVYPKLNFKRHTIKKLNTTCLITNLNVGKW